MNPSDTGKLVAVYARVSTEHEAQLQALDYQVEWYNKVLQQHPEWKLVETYVDQGITGTAAKKRPQFMKMIEDVGTADEQHSKSSYGSCEQRSDLCIMYRAVGRNLPPPYFLP